MDGKKKEYTEMEVTVLLSKERRDSAQYGIMNAWVSKDFKKFKTILSEKNFDLDQVYDDFYGLRLIDLTCKVVGCEEYVKAILDAGVEVNQLNPNTKKGPVHYAAETGNFPVMQLLTESGADANAQDGEGETPFHTIIKKWESGRSYYMDCFKLLLELEGIELNIPNHKGYTPVHLAAAHGEMDFVEMFLDKEDLLDIDSYRVESSNPTAREEIINNFPQLEERLPMEWGTSPLHGNATYRYKLFHLILHNQEIRFCQAFREAIKNDLEKVLLLRYSDGRYSYLQYACEQGMTKAAKMLLRHGADPNYAPGRSAPPIALACRQGHHEVLTVLLDSKDLCIAADENGELPLHMVVKCRANSSGHQACLKRLLRHSVLDVNAQDFKGKTPLHFAVKYGDEKCVFELLDNGAHMNMADKFGETPLANISFSMLKKYLDSKIMTNEELPKDSDYAVLFDYRFLSPHTMNKFDGDEDPIYSFKTDLLLYLAKSTELRKLMAHPIFSTIIFFKWHRIRLFFYINLIFYTLFCILLTAFIFFDKNNLKYMSVIDGVNASDIRAASITSAAIDEHFLIVTKIILFLFAGVLGFSEVVQLITSRLQYFQIFENYLQITVVILTILLLAVGGDDCSTPQLSAFCTLLTWCQLFFTVGKHPKLTFYIDMFRTASVFLLRFLTFHTPLIIAFALSFHILFRGHEGNPFTNTGSSFFKTIVMLTGEFDTDEIPFDAYRWTSHVIFVAFIFLVSIVLFNLLIGLAVSATRPIEDDAFLYGCISQVPIIAYFENAFFNDSNPFRRCLHYICMMECCYRSKHCYEKSQPVISVFPNQRNRMEVQYLSGRVEKSTSASYHENKNKNVNLPFRLDKKIVLDSQYIITNKQDKQHCQRDKMEDLKAQMELYQVALEEEIRSCKTALVEILEKLETQDLELDAEMTATGCQGRPRKKKKSKDALLKKMKDYGTWVDERVQVAHAIHQNLSMKRPAIT